eukprot:7174260-Pyramimonas_sp.AAC.2
MASVAAALAGPRQCAAPADGLFQCGGEGHCRQGAQPRHLFVHGRFQDMDHRQLYDGCHP